MYLYEKKDKDIYIYSLEANMKKLIDYRLEEMNDFDVLFFTAETDAGSPNKVLEISSYINDKDLNVKDRPIFMFSDVTAYNNNFHSFKIAKTNPSILNKFTLGAYNDKRVVTVYKEHVFPNFEKSDEQVIQMHRRLKGIGTEGYINGKPFTQAYITDKETIYYLLITDYYKLQNLSNHAVMENIISIPKSLYLLQLLQQGNFNKIGDEDITSQLSLFDFNYNPISIIPSEYLENAIKYGLIDTKYEQINQKLEESSKILRKLR